MHIIYDMFPELDLHYTDPAQHIITVGQDLNDLDHDRSDLSVRCVQLSVVVILCSGCSFPSVLGNSELASFYFVPVFCFEKRGSSVLLLLGFLFGNMIVIFSRMAF